MRTGVLAAALFFATGARTDAALTEAPRLAAIYDSILGAQFERADAQLRASCPPAPSGACLTLGIVSLWWQILIEPGSRQLDRRFETQAEGTIAANRAWTRREPQNAEAWFYLAGAYAPLVQWRVLRGQRLAAARDGATIKEALERAIELDPDLHDAHFGIGLYRYYADVAPTYAKLLRWLLFLPGGDRVKGLAEMRRTREHGQLLTGEADFQLQQLYLWYEQRPRDAIALLHSLDDRYPGNPVFLERVADAHEQYLHDLDASASAWRTLRDRARAGRVFASRAIEMRADEKLRALATPLRKFF